MATTPGNMELYGTEEAPVSSRTLCAGALSAILQEGNLRAIRFLDVEILRGVSFLVRDTGWGTYAPVLSALEVDEGDERFSIRYEARCEGAEGRFVYRARIDADSQGNLRFSAEGRSSNDFPANRIGFVVLHPIKGVAGAYMDVEHADGARERILMPEFVAPHQPIFNIRGLTHEPAPGIRATVRMEGDAYEMEDQRNWTDASFKTYVRPLSEPRPFVLRADEPLSQSVTLSIEGRRESAARSSNLGDVCTIEIGGAAGVLPQIGLALDPGDADEALGVLPNLRTITPQWLAIRVSESSDLAAAGAFASALGSQVLAEIVIPGVSPDQEIERQRMRLAAAGVTPKAVVVCPARDMRTRATGAPPDGEADISQIIDAARRKFPNALVGGGMLTFFTELNRNPPPAAKLDFVTHGASAIVHAADDASVMETLEAWPHVLRSTRNLFGELPYWLGSTTLGMRENPYGAAPAANPDKRRVAMARFDPRHQSLFGAAWALGVFAAAAKERVAVITLAHAAGDFGLTTRRSETVRETPMLWLLKSLSLSGRGRLLETRSDPRVAAIAIDLGDRTEVLVANLTAEALTMGVAGAKLEVLEGVGVRGKPIEKRAKTEFVALGPYELRRCRT